MHEELEFWSTKADTPAGRYMRRFWHPVYVGEKLKSGKAVPIRILNEDLTLYRGDEGAPFVVDFRCAHRRTQLSLNDHFKTGH